MYIVTEILRANVISWKGRYGGWLVKVVRRGLRMFAAKGGKYGRDIVCNSKTQMTMRVSQRQYFPHSKYPSSPKMYINTAATP